MYVDMMRYHYFVHPSRYKNAEWWAKGLMRRLLGITHRQWLHRNANVHIKKRDGKTQVQHEEIMDKVRDLLYTDPMDLLEEDRHLLQEDFAFQVELLLPTVSIGFLKWKLLLSLLDNNEALSSLRHEVSSNCNTIVIITRNWTLHQFNLLGFL